MTDETAKPAARELLAAKQALADQIAALPEDDLLAELEVQARAFKAGPLAAMSVLAEAIPHGVLKEYVVSLINVTGGVLATAAARRADLAAASAELAAPADEAAAD